MKVGRTLALETMRRNAMSNHEKTDKKLTQLRHTCAMTSDRYLELVSQTCEKLSKFDLAPIPIDERAKLVLWRRKEDVAHRAYIDARSQLMDYLTGATAA
jgi:hypothetical protein